MKFLVIDDEIVFTNTFIKKLNSIINTDYNQLQVESVFPEQLCMLNNLNTYDVIFLDIDLGNCNGIELSKSIKSIHPDCILVFISNRVNFIFKAIEVQPFYFIRKSFLDDDLKVFYTLFKEHMKKDFKTLLINSKGIIKPIKTKKISFIESMGHNLVIHTNDDSITYRESMKNIKKDLQIDKKFVQIHKSFIVNLDKIKEIEVDEILLVSNKRVPIGGRYKKQFLTIYTEYLLIC